MPLIRYKTDDIAVPMDVQCPCGVKLPLLKSIDGRQNDLLMTLDGRSISPWRFFPYPFDDYTGIIQFKIAQERKDKIVFQLVLEDTFDMSRLDEARERIKNLFGEEMQIDFRFIEKFDREKSGKARTISRLF
jgi:phenylacetate-CoA ligase